MPTCSRRRPTRRVRLVRLYPVKSKPRVDLRCSRSVSKSRSTVGVVAVGVVTAPSPPNAPILPAPGRRQMLRAAGPANRALGRVLGGAPEQHVADQSRRLGRLDRKSVG